MTAHKIVFLTSGHMPLDDRIFYHMADTLRDYSPVIISSKETFSETRDGIGIDCFDGNEISKKDKINLFIQKLSEYNPDLIVCSEPLPILAAHKYKRSFKKKCKIVYDVTEWYPTASSLAHFSLPKKLIQLVVMSFLNLYSAALCSGFIFGDYYKSLPFKLLYPFKRKTYISYYPDLKYIKHTPARNLDQTICLGYTGKISRKRGIGHFIDVVRNLKQEHPELHIRVKIVGWFASKDEDVYFQNIRNIIPEIEVIFLSGQRFENFSESLQDIDIFFDLRKPGIENNLSLPIKLFFYAACGRPVIYSRLKSISREIEIEQFGFMVNPKRIKVISNIISNYISDKKLYQLHSSNARELSEKKYNWGKLQPELIRFIQSFIS